MNKIIGLYRIFTSSPARDCEKTFFDRAEAEFRQKFPKTTFEELVQAKKTADNFLNFTVQKASKGDMKAATHWPFLFKFKTFIMHCITSMALK